MTSSEPTYAPARLQTVGRQLFISGQVPRDADGRTVGAGDFDAQCRHVFKSILKILGEQNFEAAHVDRLMVYVTSPELIRRASVIRGEFFSGPYPACTSVAVLGLADPDWMIEIEASASAQ